MTKKKAHIDETSTRHYLNKEMTDAERNAFEKELQKDSFAAEAMQGLELLSGAAFDRDLKELKTRINKPKKKRRIPYYAAAASILLLVTAGVLWMQLDKQNPVPQTTESRIQEETIKKEESPKQARVEEEEKSEPSKIEEQDMFRYDKETSPAEKEVAQAPQKSAKPKSAAKSPEQRIELHQTEADSEILNFTIEDDEVELDEKVILAASKSQAKIKTTSQTDSNVVQGIIVSADDQQPIPGVSVTVKGTGKGVITDLDGRFNLPVYNDSSATLIASFVGMETQEFQPNSDSNKIIELEPSQLALDEVVVVGYGVQQKKELTGSAQLVKTEPRNSDAAPSIGYERYYDYLDENALLSADYPKQKLVIKVKLEVDANGNVVRILNANNSNEAYFTKAKILIENGSGWQPKYFNDRKVKSTVKLRIVFRKAENNN
jgi:hypothetical protein